MVYKSGQIFLPFCDGRTDGQTDRQREFSSLDRVCILCSAVKMNTALHCFVHIILEFWLKKNYKIQHNTCRCLVLITVINLYRILYNKDTHTHTSDTIQAVLKNHYCCIQITSKCRQQNQYTVNTHRPICASSRHFDRPTADDDNGACWC